MVIGGCDDGGSFAFTYQIPNSVSFRMHDTPVPPGAHQYLVLPYRAQVLPVRFGLYALQTEIPELVPQLSFARAAAANNFSQRSRPRQYAPSLDSAADFPSMVGDNKPTAKRAPAPTAAAPLPAC
jgi:hypothetical protein